MGGQCRNRFYRAGRLAKTTFPNNLMYGLSQDNRLKNRLALRDKGSFAEIYPCPEKALRESLLETLSEPKGHLAENGHGLGIANLDGKTVCGSGKADEKPLHRVPAWPSGQNLVLGQIAAQEKSNGIKAVLELLNYLDLSGSLVTMDAVETQKGIACWP